MDVTHNTDALLALIEEDRARRCTEYAADAARTEAQILREARTRARAQVREALTHERRRLRDRLAGCDAALATEVRLHEQRRSRNLLDAALPRLPKALALRWANSAQRDAWVAHVVGCARATLPVGQWTIAHAPGWPEAHQAALAAALAAADITASFLEDAALGAGLEVRAGCSRIDGSAAGLAADAGEVGAHLLEALAGDGQP